MNTAAIEVVGLEKHYGSIAALDGIDLRIEPGEIFGYLGPNGAGKTTTIRILLGLLRSSAGEARLSGLDCWRQRVEIKERIGYLPGDVRLYEGLPGRAVLQLFARLRATRCDYEPLAERLGLRLDQRVKEYSKGTRQKLGIVQALMHSPRVVLLDEPTTALDPLVQEEVYQLLREQRDEGVTVFFSSHVLSEVQKLCDRVAIVRSGRLLQVESVHRLRHLDQQRAEVTFADQQSGEAALVAAGFPVRREDRTSIVQVSDVDLLIKTLASTSVRTLAISPLTLEEVFFDAYRGDRSVAQERATSSSASPAIP